MAKHEHSIIVNGLLFEQVRSPLKGAGRVCGECLFTFLARQMAKHEHSIIVNRLLFEQVRSPLKGGGGVCGECFSISQQDTWLNMNTVS